MKKIILLLFLMSIPFAQNLESGKAYIVSSININSTGNIESGQSYSLVPRIVVATGSENYAGSVTPFTGCYGGKRYEAGTEVGNCLISVINSLDSDSKTDALSAYQGKVLNDKIKTVYTKNYFNPIAPSKTINGIAVTANDDGTYLLNGTNQLSENLYINLARGCGLEKGKYKFLGSPSSANYDKYFLYIEGEISNHDYGNGDIFEISDHKEYAVTICIRAGQTLDNVLFKPMITKNLEATYEDYVSYQETFDAADIFLNNGAQIGSEIDMNNLLKPGVYRQGGLDMPANSPSAHNASVLVMRRSGGANYGAARICDIIFQYWISLNDNASYFRSRSLCADYWHDWIKQ